MGSKAPGLRESDGDYMSGSLFDCLAFSPDSKRLATLLRRSPRSLGHLVVWDIADERPGVQLAIKAESNTWHEGWIDVRHLEQSDSLLLLPANHAGLGVQQLDLATTSVTHSLQGDFGESLLLLPDGQFASGLATWDYQNREALYRENSDDADDYWWLARTGATAIVGVKSDEQVGRWDLDTLKKTHPFAAHRNDNGVRVHALAGSAEHRLVATGCADHLIRIWDSETGRLLTNLRGHQRAVDALCFSPDGTTLASASRDGTTRFWDLSDLAGGESREDRPELPTRRRFQSTEGATVTVVFDRPATNDDVIAALKEMQSQLIP